MLRCMLKGMENQCTKHKNGETGTIKPSTRCTANTSSEQVSQLSACPFRCTSDTGGRKGQSTAPWCFFGPRMWGLLHVGCSSPTQPASSQVVLGSFCPQQPQIPAGTVAGAARWRASGTFPFKAEAGDSLTFPFHLSSISARQWTPWKNSSPPQSCPTGQHSPAMEGQPSVSSPARHLRVVFFSSGVAHRAKTLRGVLRREPPSTATCTPTAHKPAQDGQTGQGPQNRC